MLSWFGKDYNVPNGQEWHTETTPTPKNSAPYCIGITSDNELQMYVGNSTLTMNIAAVDDLIDQLSMYSDQMRTRQQTQEANKE